MKLNRDMIRKTKKHLIEINRFRSLSGMKHVKVVVKQCLKCEADFNSYGYNHRMCANCKHEYDNTAMCCIPNSY